MGVISNSRGGGPFSEGLVELKSNRERFLPHPQGDQPKLDDFKSSLPMLRKPLATGLFVIWKRHSDTERLRSTGFDAGSLTGPGKRCYPANLARLLTH